MQDRPRFETAFYKRWKRLHKGYFSGNDFLCVRACAPSKIPKTFFPQKTVRLVLSISIIVLSISLILRIQRMKIVKGDFSLSTFLCVQVCDQRYRRRFYPQKTARVPHIGNYCFEFCPLHA